MARRQESGDPDQAKRYWDPNSKIWIWELKSENSLIRKLKDVGSIAAGVSAALLIKENYQDPEAFTNILELYGIGGAIVFGLSCYYRAREQARGKFEGKFKLAFITLPIQEATHDLSLAAIGALIALFGDDAVHLASEALKQIGSGISATWDFIGGNKAFDAVSSGASSAGNGAESAQEELASSEDFPRYLIYSFIVATALLGKKAAFNAFANRVVAPMLKAYQEYWDHNQIDYGRVSIQRPRIVPRDATPLNDTASAYDAASARDIVQHMRELLNQNNDY